MSETNDTFKEELAQIDERIVSLKNDIELGAALERLHENEDFIKVFVDNYFEKEAKRIFELLTEPTALKREQLENLNDMMATIRYFKKYIQTLLINANMAPDQIEEEEMYRKEITSQNSLMKIEE